MVDFRLYRLAFAPALLAVIVIMFSLQAPPAPLEPALPPGTFEGARATAAARQIATSSPDRRPGSAADDATADFVAERFSAIPAGTTSEQRFEAAVDGEEVELRNVILTLPGDVAETVAIVAPRGSSEGPGAASSAAATGVLVELANALGVSGHERTYVLASVGGTVADAAGADEVLAAMPDGDRLEAVIVISQVGAASLRQPFVVATSTGADSAPTELERTAAGAVTSQVGEAPARPAAFTQLARLAIPSGLGGQAPLIAAGIDAIAISAAGEPPLPAASDLLDDLSGESVDGFGRAVQATVSAIDLHDAPLERGPRAYVEIAGNLIPGWSIAVLALALILPAGVAALDASARAARRRIRLGRALAWAASLSVPLIGALAVLYALALVGLVPRPEFPFDPRLHPIEARAAVTFALLAAAAVATAYVLRRSLGEARPTLEAAVPALGVVGVISATTVWIVNPYLGLLAAPCTHVWLLGGLRQPARWLALASGAAAVAALVPVAAAIAAVSSALELDRNAPWTFALMIADGQIGLDVALATCFLLGSLAGVTIAAVSPKSAREQGFPGPAARGVRPALDRTSVESGRLSVAQSADRSDRDREGPDRGEPNGGT